MMFTISGSMISKVTSEQVADVSHVKNDSERESEKPCSLVWLSV